ncbi:cyclic GMP-AMP synthase-like receptor isoform X1 [Branchiostoma lanceolatum]|uniref:cyclic GMP-AMP synthase-like receptor isoform X1 n=1 Tax=Branchiostoma lanceolatum TaxID=7740 RepID=UPI00345260A0
MTTGLVAQLGERAALQDVEETAAIREAVETTVQALARGVARRDARFECEVIPSGSFYEGTKIVKADEFDFMLCLKALSLGTTSVSGQPGTEDVEMYRTSAQATDPHVYLRLVKPELQEMWTDCLVETSMAATISEKVFGEDIGMVLLNGGKLKATFYHHLKTVLPEVQHQRLTWLGSSLKTLERILGKEGGEVRGVPEALDFAWDGDKSKRISVDVCLTLHVNRWSGVSDVDRRYGPSHPHNEIIEEATGQGFHVVPKFQFYWRLSWSRAEASLLANIFKKAPSARQIYKVAKLINENNFLDHYNLPSKICDSYTLKTVLFHVWFDTTEAEWADIGSVFLRYLRKLHDSIKEGNLPHFFIKTHNLSPLTDWSVSKATALEKCIDQIKAATDVDAFLQSRFVIEPTEEVKANIKPLRDRKIRVLTTGQLKPPGILSQLKEMGEMEEGRNEEGAVGGEEEDGGYEKEGESTLDVVAKTIATIRDDDADKANL